MSLSVEQEGTMKKILQRLVTISVNDTGSIIQPPEEWGDMEDCDRVTIFTQVYGFTCATSAAKIQLYIENSSTGDAWVDVLGGANAVAVPYGPLQTVLTGSTDVAKFVGPLFRWRVLGISGPTSITFRAIVTGVKTK
jgi:hypothetical protein